jgi:hypothetical protein
LAGCRIIKEGISLISKQLSRRNGKLKSRTGKGKPVVCYYATGLGNRVDFVAAFGKAPRMLAITFAQNQTLGDY